MFFSEAYKATYWKKKISKITADDIEKFYTSLMRKETAPLQIGSIAEVDRIIKPALQIAVKRNMIRTNPAAGCLGIVQKKNQEPPEPRHAIEEDSQRNLAGIYTPTRDTCSIIHCFMFWRGLDVV